MRLPPFAEAPGADDSERFAAMSPQERIALCLELCDLTESIVSGRPDGDAIRQAHPRSVKSLALWRRLMQGYSGGQTR